jgi:predicted porin
MKKSLIALAALSAFAATAQAQSSVTVYGIVDTGYNSVERNLAGSKTTVSQVRTNGEAATSRLGFRGTEDLGSGMKANFVVETTIGNTMGNNTSSFTNIGSRLFWAGLEDAKLGQVRIGLQNTAARDLWLAHDQLAMANVVGNLAHDNTTALAADVTTVSHLNVATAVNYMSPRINGIQFVGGVMENTSEAANGVKTKTGSGSQVGLNYAAGKLSAAVAMTSANNDTAAVNGAAASYVNSGSIPTSSTTQTLGTVAVTQAFSKTKDTAAAVSYDFGAIKVAYIYNDRDTTNGIQRKSNSFSASVPVSGKLVARVGYGFGDYAASPTATKYDISGMQAALNYNLSKRTMAYAIYGDEKRDVSASTSNKAKEYSVGVRHSF